MITDSLWVRPSTIALLLVLCSCTAPIPDQAEIAPATEAPAAESTVSEVDSAAVNVPDITKTPPSVSLLPGRYCFSGADETTTVHARMRMDPDARITGDLAGAVTNEAEGYFTSYRQALDGTIDGNTLNLDVTTWIEFDQQNTQETWQISEQTLSTERETLQAQSCEEVSKVFQNEEGLEASDLIDSADNIETQRVKFAGGKSGTTLSDSVVRGDRHVYLLSAQGGQTMSLDISSLEDNAVFDVVSPSGYILMRESMSESVPLPETGEYKVIVGGTRGNATYDLAVSIE